MTRTTGLHSRIIVPVLAEAEGAGAGEVPLLADFTGITLSAAGTRPAAVVAGRTDRGRAIFVVCDIAGAGSAAELPVPAGTAVAAVRCTVEAVGAGVVALGTN